MVRYPPRNNGTSAFHRVTYEDAQITDQLQLAWATTVHKVGGLADTCLLTGVAQGGCRQVASVVVALVVECCCAALSTACFVWSQEQHSQLLSLLGSILRNTGCLHNMALTGAGV